MGGINDQVWFINVIKGEEDDDDEGAGGELILSSSVLEAVFDDEDVDGGIRVDEAEEGVTGSCG